MSEEKRRLLYLAIRNPNYPRNSRIRDFIDSKFEIICTPSVEQKGNYIRRLTAIFLDGCKSRPTKVVVLSELNLQYAPAAWLLAKLLRAVLVVDWFVGMYETNILDWNEAPSKSLKARLYLLMDYFAVFCADIVTTDTDLRAERLRRWARRSTTVVTLPVGSPEWVLCRPKPANDKFTALFYGDYIPLHGVDVLLRACAQSTRMEDGKLFLVGSSTQRPKYEALAEELSIADRCEFIDHLPTSDLNQLITFSDIIFGIFGSSEKASSVIPNKVWQGLSAGRVVITRKSSAYAEIREIAGTNLVEVEPDPSVIARAIDALDIPVCENSALRRELEKYVLSRFTRFADVLDRAC